MPPATPVAPALKIASPPPSDAPRRAAALKAAAAAARRVFGGAPAALSWRDFEAATAEVERVRARVRALGPGARFVDEWCDAPAALGPRIDAADHEWVDWARIAPSPVLVAGGFEAADIRQGEVGDCYLLAAATALTHTPAALDAVFVTAEPNDEGVFCVRWCASRRAPRARACVRTHLSLSPPPPLPQGSKTRGCGSSRTRVSSCSATRTARSTTRRRRMRARRTPRLASTACPRALTPSR